MSWWRRALRSVVERASHTARLRGSSDLLPEHRARLDDLLDEVIAERAATNPDFPGMVDRAQAARER